MTAYANINGETLIEVSLHVPNVGPWWADVVFETAPSVSGRVTLNVGELRLVGTLRSAENGTFGEQRRARIVGGAGGWGTFVSALHYHNDAGVRALSVAQDVARIAGETIGTFNVAEASLGIDYVREAGTAARVLEDVIGGAPWHVDFDGNTNVGVRSTSKLDANEYQVLHFDPREKLAIIAVDDLSAVSIGSVISEGLDSEETIREMRIEVTADTVRIYAWCGGNERSRGRLAEALRSAIRRATDDRIFGKWRYRLVQMSVDRVELQAVVRNGPVPDILPISMKPGVAGAHAKLTPGTIVLVEFLEGDRRLPVVTAFAGKDESGYEPQELDFAVTTTLRLGSNAATEGVPYGDSLKSWLDAHTHSYIAPGSGGTNALTTPPASTPAGDPDPSPSPSTKVKVA